jgi:hypothetical protein
MSDPTKRPEIVALNLPENAAKWPRVRVKRGRGERWVEIGSILPTDVVEINPKTSLPFTMTGRPGRPRKPETGFSPHQIPNQLPAKGRHEMIRKDPLVGLITRDPDSADVLHAVMASMAVETASLLHSRLEAGRGEDWDPETVSKISKARVQVLRSVRDVWVTRREYATSGSVDMDSPAFKAMFEFLIQTFVDVMESDGMRAEQIGTLIQMLSAKMSDPDWNAEVKQKMREAG